MKYSLLLLLFFFLSCKKEQEKKSEIKIAFLADVHLQDIRADFSDTNYRGVLHPITGDYYTIRTMESQLHSTRLFNENYFAFIAALDNLVFRGIKLVALPGDFSDDGQPVHILALKKILTEYTQKHGMQFFLTTGNHDPVRPFTEKGGKYDFLGENGQMLAIVSDSSLLKASAGKPQGIVTEKIKNWGYKEIAGALSDFGFFPKKEFLYWESPYKSSSYDTYDFETTRSQSYVDDRTYPMKNTMLAIPDLSYLVEPLKDIWLLAIDANVYIPKEHTLDTTLFSGTSIGYNNVIQYKQHLI
ncbi:MAG: metallophosphoesterase, partial [Maribacter sp.]